MAAVATLGLTDVNTPAPLAALASKHQRALAASKHRLRPCRFRFGTFFHGADTLADPHDYNGIDYVAAWIGQSALDSYLCEQAPCFNPYWHGAMLQLARERGLSVAYYAYVIAFLAKATGLFDCDVGEPSLCQRGADYIRNNRRLILHTYARFANETAKVLGRSAEVLWLMEPDWHQYHEDTQEGGGLSHEEMVALLQAMIQQVKHFLPRAKISLDISPWVRDQEGWLRPFLRGCSIDFLHTSGGRTSAGSPLIRANDAGNTVRWAEVHRLSGLGVIADAGYGVGGAYQGLDASWDDPENLRSRIGDGVVAVTQARPCPRRAALDASACPPPAGRGPPPPSLPHPRAHQANPGDGWGDALSLLREELPRPFCGWTDPVYAPAAPPASEPHEEAAQVRAAGGPWCVAPGGGVERWGVERWGEGQWPVGRGAVGRRA
jgi:hypothetical protein